MSVDIRVNIERLEDGCWVNPADLEAIYSREAHARFGFADIEVCCFSEKGPQQGLFFGPFAVVPMHLGLPDDLCPELQYLRNKSAQGVYDGWCWAEELCLDSWQTESVLISNRVSVQLAQFFGNGQRQVSELRQDIQHHGVPDHEIDWMLRFGAQLTTTPEDWANHRRYQLRQLDQSESVLVTWRETYAECAGPDLWDRGLSRLRAIGNLQSYRLVTNRL